MQHFKDTSTGQIYSFEDDVKVTTKKGINSFTGVTGALIVPTTLKSISDADFAIFLANQAAAAALLPNPIKFADDIKSGMGGIIGANTLTIAYPLFFPTIQQQVWADVQILILDAQTKNVITLDQFTAIKSAAADNNIPLTL